MEFLDQWEMGHKLHYETKLLYQSFCFVKGIEAKLRNSKEDKFILHTFPSKEKERGGKKTVIGKCSLTFVNGK